MKIVLSMLFIIMVIADQVTKITIKKSFVLYDSITVIDGFFNITYVLNPGAAFGFLSGMNESYRRIFFVVVTIVAICAVIYLLLKEINLKFRAVAYTLILSGAVGNFIDRVYLGKVIDFLDFYYGGHHWPAFNIADSCITIGITILIIDIFFSRKGVENESNA